MQPKKTSEDRPEIAGAGVGADSLRMEGEPDPQGATLEQALLWRNIYSEILTKEEAVLERIKQLTADQSPEARRELELTDVRVVVAQFKRCRSRLGFWETCIQAHQ